MAEFFSFMVPTLIGLAILATIQASFVKRSESDRPRRRRSR